MEVEKQESSNSFHEETEDVENLRSLVKNHSLIELLLKTADINDEKIGHIDHISNSFKLIQYEALDCYLYLLQGVFSINRESTKRLLNGDQIKIEHMLKLLKYVAKRPVGDFTGDNEKQSSLDHLLKIIDLIHELFVYFDSRCIQSDAQMNSFSISQKTEIIDLIRVIFAKYKASLADLCIKLSRILALLSIKERNSGFNMQKEIIQVNYIY
jgi:hypothetical protein